jgi:hypothetical protein
MMAYSALFILVFNLLFLVILPHFLWIRWIIRAFRNRRVVGRVIAPLSYLLFLLPWVLVFQGSQRSCGWLSVLLSEDAIVLSMLIGAILLPLGYFYARWVYAAYREQQWKAVYIRLSCLLLVPLFGFGVHLFTELDQRQTIGQDLGISLPYWGMTVIEYRDNISSFRGEGEINATLALDADALAELQEQIRQTTFYDSSKHVLHGADELAWAKSDTVFYWKVRDHLEATHLTGLWVYDPEKGVYEFYEPNLSDIPNASILFKETYTLSAEVNLKTRTLSYTRWQF